MPKLLRQFLLIATLTATFGLFIVPLRAVAQGGAVIPPVITKNADGTNSLVSQGVVTQISDEQVAAIKNQPKGGCNFLNFSILDCIYGTIGLFIWHVVIPAVGLVLWLVGMMIDWIVTLSFDPTFYNHPAIKTSWSIIRDLCNMVFIFVLIYAGFQMILNLPSANLKKTVTGVIIAALLINFSYFITKVVIDVSNIGTGWFIQGVKNVGGGNGVSDSVRGVLQMEKLVKNDQFGENAITLESFVTGLALIILTCVAIYVLFRIFFMLLGRLVSFMFLLITAPVGFLRWVELPRISDFSKKWWDELLCQATTAPVFFLLLYITLYIVDQVDTLVFSTQAATTTLKTGTFAPVNYVMFAIIIFMLLKALELSKDKGCEMGNMVGDLFKSSAGMLSGFAFGGVTAGLGAVGRQTIGRRAFAISQDKDKMKSIQERAATSMVARMQLATINKAASSSFDARATTLGKNAAGFVGNKVSILGIGSVDTSKVDLDKTTLGGFKAGVDKFKDDEKKFAEKLGKGKAGEFNRMRYAEDKQNSWFNNYILNPGIRYKDVYDDLSDTAYKGYTKSEKEGAEKDAQKIKNYIIDNQIAADILKSSLVKNKPSEIDTAAKSATEKLDEYMEKRNKDASSDRIKLIRQAEDMDKQYDQFIDNNDPDSARKLKDDEAYKIADEARAHANSKEIATAKKIGSLTNEDYSDAQKKYKTAVIEAQKQIDSAKDMLKNAQKADDLIKKKEEIDNAIKHIDKVIIGKAGKWNGKKKEYDEKGTGLRHDLDEKKRKAEDMKNESRSIGAEGGGGGKKKDDDDDDGDDEDAGKKK